MVAGERWVERKGDSGSVGIDCSVISLNSIAVVGVDLGHWVRGGVDSCAFVSSSKPATLNAATLCSQ